MKRSNNLLRPVLQDGLHRGDRSLRLMAVLAYLRLCWFIKRHTRQDMRGLGFALRTIKHEFTFCVHGKQFVFCPDCGPAYCLLPAGIWNEPETHLFFDHLLARGGSPFHFIDVGASVGEMVMDIATRAEAVSIFAFEPQFHCANVIARSSQLNGFDRVRVRPVALSDQSGKTTFRAETRSPTAAGLANGPADLSGTTLVQVSTLDEECRLVSGNVIMLVDVEGAEPRVLAGGIQLIHKTFPCIIFEYNDTSKKHYSLNHIREVLGEEYAIYRLRSDGYLDAEWEHAWNCVAVHPQSFWTGRCHSLVVRGTKG